MPTAADIDAVVRLEAAIDSKNGRELEAAIAPLWRTEISPELQCEVCRLLISIIDATWHRCHEDAVQEIQRLHCKDAVLALERTAHAVHAYLSYDEVFGLARKCTWALADIGTPDARQALERLSRSSNPLIAGYAKKRIDRWQAELPRKLK
jgi:hypothetical protein